MSGCRKSGLWLIGPYFAVAVSVLLWAGLTVQPIHLLEVPAFLVASLILMNRRVTLANGVHLPASYSIHMAAMVILAPAAAVLCEAFLALVLSLNSRRPLRVVLFNIANFAVPTLLGSLAFRAFAPAGPGAAPLAAVVAGAIVAMVVRFVVNLFHIHLLRWLDGQVEFVSGLRAFLTMEGRAWFAIRALVLLMVLAYPAGGVVVLAIATLLMAVLDDAIQVYHTREALFRSARIDGLTQVLNRAAWEKRVSDFHPRPGDTHVLMVVDVNHLKNFNDLGGHMEGDRAIQAVASALAEVVGPDRVYRYGGDEFVVWLADTPVLSPLVKRARQALDDLRESFHSSCCPLSASVGVASAPVDGATPAELFAVADARMYEGKRRSKDRSA